MQKKTVAAIKKRNAIARAAPLPQQIFVKWSAANLADSDPFLEASETTNDLDQGEVVGVYQLTATRVMRVTRTLE